LSGWQLSGDAPIAYDRFALKVMEPWTDHLILAAGCRDGDRGVTLRSNGIEAAQPNFHLRMAASTWSSANKVSNTFLTAQRRCREWHACSFPAGGSP
jgi:hypothetical protein